MSSESKIPQRRVRMGDQQFTGLKNRLGPDLTACIRYLHGGGDGWGVVLDLLTRFNEKLDVVRAAGLFYDELTFRKTEDVERNRPYPTEETDA